MPEDEHKPLTATTVRELGIEFAGFRDVVKLQFAEINKNISDLVTALRDANDSKADKSDLEAVRTLVTTKADQKDVDNNTIRIKSLEKFNGFKSTLLWVGLVASAIINIVFIYNLFGGGNG